MEYPNPKHAKDVVDNMAEDVVDNMADAFRLVLPYLTDPLDRFAVYWLVPSLEPKDKDKPSRLPPDYDNWKATVIFFVEDFDRIYIYALNTDMCTIYSITYYERPKFLFQSIGYTSGDGKVFFAGEMMCSPNHQFPLTPLKVLVYDIPTQKWSSLGGMKSFKPEPFVFYINKKLYVLSTFGKADFEMFDFSDPSPEWETLTSPPFLSLAGSAFHNQLIIDYTNEVLYIRPNARYGYDPFVFGYSCKDDKWMSYDDVHTVPSSMRTSSLLLRAPWSDTCAIVGQYMYGFQIIKFNDLPKYRAMLIIRDLNHQIEDANNGMQCDFLEPAHSANYPPISIPGQWMVDISHIVPEEVLLKNLFAFGHLVHLRPWDSGPVMFSLIIYSEPFFVPADVYTYKLSVEVSKTGFSANGVLCSSRPMQVVRGQLSCSSHVCHVPLEGASLSD